MLGSTNKLKYLYGIVLVGFVAQKVLKYYFYADIEYVHPEIAVEARMTTTELIEKYGYKTETHFVQTEDGYILQLHRIIKSPLYNGTSTKVIFAMHGYPSSSADFSIFGPNISLAYALADNGYDIWMGNARGNRYSSNHTKLSVEDSEFWNFSFHEIGVYDLPASIDYILDKTNSTTLSYIGFSQGTSVFFVMCSERPEYMPKINHMQALAPIVFVNRAKSRLMWIAGMYGLYFDLWYAIKGPYNFLPNVPFVQRLGEIVCNEKTSLNVICTTLLFELCGYNLPQLNITKLPVFVGHIPAGSSILTVKHYGQLIQKGGFRKYDYGRNKNILKYGAKDPPDYSLSSITVPIALHSSDNDATSHPDDIERLKNVLPNVIGIFKPKLSQFNHVDFIVAKDAKKLLHHTILDILGRYT